MSIPNVHCDSNERCRSCPIERITNPDWRILAANVVRSARNDLDSTAGVPAEFVTINTIQTVAQEKADTLGMEAFIPEVVGALAITLSSNCGISIGFEKGLRRYYGKDF